MQINPHPPGATGRRHTISAREEQEDEIVIGLFNIMPPAARLDTERQFQSLLTAAAGGRKLRLRLFTVHDERHRIFERLNSGSRYEGLEALMDARLDGLIVTGTEPRAAAMTDEPYWPAFTKLVDWAAVNTVSTIFSCFAAHAAVLHMDGIPRAPFADKLSGVFPCTKAADHHILSGMPARWVMPHSRYNSLSEAALSQKDYVILSHVSRVGVDMFTKRYGRSQFLFLQGHPEYGSEILFREYCRDIRRFVSGQSLIYPKQPEHYFDPASHAAFTDLQARAHLASSEAFVLELEQTTPKLQCSGWRHVAERLYAQWLSLIGARTREYAELNA